MFYKFRIVSVLVILFLVISGALFAQEVQELRLGVMFSTELQPEEEEWFSVHPTETGFLVVETFGDIDTILEAYDSSRTFINSDDDGGEGYNARLEIFAEMGNTYLFKLGAFDEDEAGPYRILASIEPIPPDTDRNIERSRAVPIRLGEAFPVIFRTPDETRWYSYNILREGTLFVVQTRGSMDTLLTLYDDNGNIIAEDDDSGESYNAFISVRRGPGTVFIEVTGYDGKMGRCTLHAETR